MAGKSASGAGVTRIAFVAVAGVAILVLLARDEEDRARLIAQGFLAKIGRTIDLPRSRPSPVGRGERMMFIAYPQDGYGSTTIDVDLRMGLVRRYSCERIAHEGKGPADRLLKTPDQAVAALERMARRVSARWPLVLRRWSMDRGPIGGVFQERHLGYGALSRTNQVGVVIDPYEGKLLSMDQAFDISYEAPRVRLTAADAIVRVREYQENVGARSRLGEPAKPVILGYTVPWERFGGPGSDDPPPYQARLAYDVWTSKYSSCWVDAENGRILGGEYVPVAE